MKDFFVRLSELCSAQFVDPANGERFMGEVTSYSDRQFKIKINRSLKTCQKLLFDVRLPSSTKQVSGDCLLVRQDESHQTLQILRFEGNQGIHWVQSFEKKILNYHAEDIMHKSPYAVSPSNPIKDVILGMKQINAGSAVITDNLSNLLGIFTERDIMNHCTDESFFTQPVGRYMTSNLSTIHYLSPIEEVYMKFQNATFRHLPVVDGAKIVGIISMRDLIQYWAKLLEIQKSTITQKYDKTMGVIVHDLRSPIYAIRSINEVLLQQIDSPQSYYDQGFPKLIDDSCDTMIALIEDLLEMSEHKFDTTSLDKELLQISDLTLKSIETFTPSANAKNIKIEKKISPDLPLIDVDKKRFDQISSNLISNAIKYSDKNSSIEVSLAKNNEHIILSVIDHGQGIKPEELDKIFDEMCKISSKPTNNEPSTGLGLSIVKRLVEAHNGTIQVTSQPFKQTCFSVYLPIQSNDEVNQMAA